MADSLPGALNASPSTHASCGLCAVIGQDTPFVVKVLHSSETELCRLGEDSGVAEVNCGDLLVVNTRYGGDLARVLGPVEEDNSVSWDHEREVLRVAADTDIARFEDNLRLEDEAFEVCRRKIDSHGLSMKLVSCHYVLDEPKILFFFTAESRVDFRDLVKDLVSEFRMRIELRQIGVRDDSRVLGGTGVCGRVLCCHGVTDKLRPVSIKMAKVQNLSLNSMKISGPCGRLLCCLAYEYDHYTEQKRKLPNDGVRINYDGSSFQVCDVNLISNRVRLVSRDEGRYITVSGEQLSYDHDGRRWSISGEIPPAE